jgi:hypothetical protein
MEGGSRNVKDIIMGVLQSTASVPCKRGLSTMAACGGVADATHGCAGTVVGRAGGHQSKRASAEDLGGVGEVQVARVDQERRLNALPLQV